MTYDIIKLYYNIIKFDFMPEQQPKVEDNKEWKAPKTGADESQETQEVEEIGGEALTPETMMEQVPEEDRGALRKMAEKFFGSSCRCNGKTSSAGGLPSVSS
jgi:hypothetical protein